MEKINVETLFSEAIMDEEHFEEHLRRYLEEVFDGPGIRQAMLEICQSQRDDEDHHFHRLKGAGLIKKVDKQVIPRNKLYARYFEKRLNY